MDVNCVLERGQPRLEVKISILCEVKKEIEKTKALFEQRGFKVQIESNAPHLIRLSRKRLYEFDADLEKIAQQEEQCFLKWITSYPNIHFKEIEVKEGEVLTIFNDSSLEKENIAFQKLIEEE